MKPKRKLPFDWVRAADVLVRLVELWWRMR